MRWRNVLGILVSAAVVAAVPLAANAFILTLSPIDTVGHVPLLDFNTNYNGFSYKDFGNEPFVAANPLNPQQIVVSGFNFATGSTTSPDVSASLLYSTNGGLNWQTVLHLPSPAPGVFIPADQTYAYDSLGIFHAGVLGVTGGSTNLFHGTTPNIATTNITWGAGIVNSAAPNTADQPWLSVKGTNVSVGYTNFPGGFLEDPHVSSFPFAPGNDVSVSGGGVIVAAPTNPGTRTATDSAGKVYTIWGFSDSTNGSTPHMKYFINHLVGGVPQDGAGLTIDDGFSTQGNIAGNSFGGVNMLRGDITSIATTASGNHIYVAYGKKDGPPNTNTGTDRIWVREFHPSGLTLVPGGPPVVFSIPNERAALPNITVLDNGTIELQYDTVGSDGKINVHLAESTNGGLSPTSDSVLYSFAPPPISSVFPGSDRELGDYQYLMQVGNVFMGVFAGLGNVNIGGIDTTTFIDPFFYEGTTGGVPVPEPASILLFGSGLAGILLFGRMRRPQNGL